ncbi:hypothetical protein F5880DRAFT_781090 [Lentinula raphanica]|nr:hypothetical protein F5880DRAFT_781090 [Lentinula raphanica]
MGARWKLVLTLNNEVAELKQKAVKAKDATVTSVQNTRDRHTSVPLKKTNWNPYDGSGPPPPPAPRTNSWTKPPKPEPPTLPPPIRRDTSNSSEPSRSPRTPSTSPSPSPSASPALPSRGGPPVVNRATRPPRPAGRVPSSSLSPTNPSPRPVMPPRTPSGGNPPSLPSRTPSLPPRTPSLPPSLPSRTPSSSSYQKTSVKEESESEIDWANLSPDDKRVFFSWLDEFFERSYGIRAA